MDKQHNDQWLEDILTNPAKVKDLGFTQSLLSEIRTRQVRRRSVFIGTACSWVIVAVLILSNQEILAIFQRVQALAAPVLQWISENSAVELIALIPTQISLQTFLLGALMVTLGFYALLSSHLRL